MTGDWSGWSNDWKQSSSQGGQHIGGHEDWHEVMDIVVEVEQELGQCDWVLLQPVWQLLRVLGLIVEHGPHHGEHSTHGLTTQSSSAGQVTVHHL